MIVTRAGQARFQTKNTTARNNTTPIHCAEPGSLKKRRRFTKAWVRWTWNQPASWWSAPASGLTIAKVAPLWGRREAFNTTKGASGTYPRSRICNFFKQEFCLDFAHSGPRWGAVATPSVRRRPLAYDPHAARRMLQSQHRGLISRSNVRPCPTSVSKHAFSKMTAC